MKTIAIIIVGFVAIGTMWFIFSPVPKERAGIPVEHGDTSGELSYSNPTFAFSVTVPKGFTVDESYINQTLGPGREIPGVAFVIPQSLSTGTNLSPDSKVAIEELYDVACVPSDFLDVDTLGTPVSIGSDHYMYATAGGAGAGNLYEESVYVRQKDTRCYAIRYFIHSTNIGNYPAGTVQEFNKADLISRFDVIAKSLIIK
jgi:hypothetical protein